MSLFSFAKHPAPAALAVAMALVWPAQAEDASVQRRLDAEDITYKVDGDGDYKATFNYPSDKRTQLVFVSGGTEDVNGTAIREIFSPAAKIEQDGVSGTKALALMEGSSRKKVGAWEIRSGVLYFVIKYPEPMSAAQLHQIMNLAGTAADNMEIEISGSKDAL